MSGARWKTNGWIASREEEYNAKHRHDSERISGYCWIGAPAITVAFVLPKLEPVAESLDKLAHGPNEHSAKFRMFSRKISV
jgi:hypothetical protein